MQWLMLQQDAPDDFVIATGEQHSVREFVTIAARELGIEMRWEGRGVDERGYANATGKRIVAVDPRYFRPTEVDTLLGNPAKAGRQLSWAPKISFAELVSEMVAADLRAAERDILTEQKGYKVFSHH